MQINNLTANVSKTTKEDMLKDFLKVFDTPAGRRVLEHLETRAKNGFPDIANTNNTYYMAGHLGNIEYCKNVVKMANQKVNKERG